MYVLEEPNEILEFDYIFDKQKKESLLYVKKQIKTLEKSFFLLSYSRFLKSKNINSKVINEFYNVHRKDHSIINFSYFLNQNYEELKKLQIGVFQKLLSFSFLLGLIDLNVNFENFGFKEYKNQVFQISKKIKKKYFDFYFLHSEKTNDKLTLKKQKKIQKIKKVVKKIILMTLIISFQFIKIGRSLHAISKFLNKLNFFCFAPFFWNKELLLTLLMNYSDFELKFAIHQSLHPFRVFHMIKMTIKECKIHPKINPHILPFISDRIGILNLSIGSAQRRQIGKSSLINKILHTSFPEDLKNPLFKFGVRLDLLSGVVPPLKYVVMDYNIPSLIPLVKLINLANMVIIQISFSDLVDNAESIYNKLRKLMMLWEKRNIHVLVIVRDWMEYQLYRSEDFGKKKVFFESSILDNDPKKIFVDPEAQTSHKIFKQVKEIQKFYKKIKVQMKKSKNDILKEKIINGKKAFEKIKAKKVFQNVHFIKLKRLKPQNYVEIKDTSIFQKIKKKTNKIIEEIKEEIENTPKKIQMSFTKKNFFIYIESLKQKTVDLINLDHSIGRNISIPFQVLYDEETKQIKGLENSLEKMIKLFGKLKRKNFDFFFLLIHFGTKST